MKVLISEIENLDNQSQNIKFCEIIDEFNPKKAVEANLSISLMGDEYINVKGNIKALLKLTCDSCLKEFEKDFSIEINETFARNSLFEEYKDEVELSEGSFIEDLNGSNEIDITDLIYQSVILNIPNKLVCGINCIGDENINKYIKTEVADPRLEIFKTIKIEKEKDN
ncbi:MAG: DUF177 domain-containing protein [Candidatus Gastranaerophilales bacterium]|nr:DUF177 domain-containing protein [Candidatus Gastranaerophilales bacterium]